MDDLVEQLRAPNEVVRAVLLLLVAESPGHGYGLVERLKAFGLASRSGSVYRELRRLEEAGLVRSFWEASQIRGPARRVYEVTPEGRTTLRACAAAARDLRRTLAGYLERREVVAHSARRGRFGPHGPARANLTRSLYCGTTSSPSCQRPEPEAAAVGLAGLPDKGHPRLSGAGRLARQEDMSTAQVG